MACGAPATPLPRAPAPADGPARAPARPTRSLVLQGGHVGLIFDAALHPTRDVVALISIDMPDWGQAMTPVRPWSTVTLLDVPTRTYLASWRVRSPDTAGEASLAFSTDGNTLIAQGDDTIRWDLTTGREQRSTGDARKPPPDVESDDGRFRLGNLPEDDAHEGARLFDNRVERFVSKLVMPEPDVGAPSTTRYAFAPGSHRLWGCRHEYTYRPVEASPTDPSPAPAQAGAVEEDAEEVVVDWIHCTMWNADAGGTKQSDFRFELPVSPYGLGPVSITETGPELVVARSGELVIPVMRHVLVASPEGVIAHRFEDVGIEEMLQGVRPAPDGSAVAIASGATLSYAGRHGHATMQCPGFVDQGARLRFRPRGVASLAQRFVCRLPERTRSFHEAILGVSASGDALVVAGEGVMEAEGRVYVTRAGGDAHELPGVSAWCHPDGCGPEAHFTAGDTRVAIGERVFDARTGQRLHDEAPGDVPQAAADTPADRPLDTSYEGTRATLRSAGGRSLDVRIVVYPDRGAWMMAEDGAGHWYAEDALLPVLRVREPGPLLSAAMHPATAGARGYSASLVEDFFADGAP